MLSILEKLLIAFLQCHRLCLCRSATSLHPPSSYLISRFSYGPGLRLTVGCSQSEGFRKGWLLGDWRGNVALKVLKAATPSTLQRAFRAAKPRRRNVDDSSRVECPLVPPRSLARTSQAHYLRMVAVNLINEALAIGLCLSLA